MSKALLQREKNNQPRKFNLESSMKRKDTDVPEIFYRIIEGLDKRLDIESLYRKPGNKEKILKLQKKNPDKIKFEDVDPHDLASWLKMILTEMEEPLLPKDMFENFKKDPSQPKLKEDLTKLNNVRRHTLEHLMKHILKVTEKEKVNKMNKENMCIVWAPVMYYPLESRADAEKCIEFFGALMDIYDPRNKIAKTRYVKRRDVAAAKKENESGTTTENSAGRTKEANEKNYKQLVKSSELEEKSEMGMLKTKGEDPEEHDEVVLNEKGKYSVKYHKEKRKDSAELAEEPTPNIDLSIKDEKGTSETIKNDGGSFAYTVKLKRKH